MNVFVMLLHSPMVNRKGEEVTTAVTNLDIHDIARSCKTYGVTRYFIVNPEEKQKQLVGQILEHWNREQSEVFHPLRVKALSQITYSLTFEEAMNDATVICGGERPVVAMPDARPWPNTVNYKDLRAKLESGEVKNLMIVFGTGWGIAPRFFEKMDLILAPLKGRDAYNHLSVRAACAIVLDKLLGFAE